MRSRYKPWAIEYLKTNTKNEFFLNDEVIEEEKIISFIKEKDTYLEIGPGRGQFILSMAAKFPQFNFLVIELDKSIAGTALKKIDEANLTNVRLIAGDFYKLSKILKKDLFCGVFLNFSDPWPKKRHEKRRLTSHEFLKRYDLIFKGSKNIIQKTDNIGLFAFSLQSLSTFGYVLNFVTLDLHQTKTEDNVMTEYEKKFVSNGVKICMLKATKKA